jgi:hypothetical protein
MLSLHNLIHRLNIIPIKISSFLWVNVGNIIQNFLEKDKGTRIATTILTKKNRVGGNQSTLSKDLLYSYNNQHCVVLSYRSMKKNREPRKRPTQIFPNDF